MFDIVSFVREKIFRRPKLKVEAVAWEELSEKQTTKLWYFLLYCMFWAIIASAQWTLSIIEEIPEKPTDIPYCITSLVNNLSENKDDIYYYDSYNYSYDNCQISSETPKFDFDPEYSSLSWPNQKIIDLNNSISTLESQKSTFEYNLTQAEQNYNTSLTEKIADENNQIYDKNKIQEDIKNNHIQIENTEKQISILNDEISKIKKDNSAEVDKLKEKLKKAEEDYKSAYLMYRLIVAVLSFVFSIVVFFALYRIYVKQKVKNSPHTIIFSVATFAYWLVLLQIAVMFIWDIIPHKLLKLVLEFLSYFEPVVYLLQFLWPVIIIWIFWFLVYKIQKRLYSPENVLKRFISDKKCPNCWNSVDFTKPFCPLCSHEIQVKCKKCNNLTVKWMPYCSSCWEKI